MLPPSERERLQEIADLAPFGDAVRALLADLPAEAARRLALPVGLVTIVLDRALEIAAGHGLSGWLAEAGGAPREWAFCRHVVDEDGPVRIPDAAADPREDGNPLVHVDGARCYAGAPLRSSRGHVLGTLCVLGDEARTFTDGELAVLEALADEAVRRLEAHADGNAG